jgi:3,4-dihydroxy 2-butanone 4-phosphate synthase/GTP cyclohydrolase II
MLIKQAAALIPTPWGDFMMTAFANGANEPLPTIVLSHPDMQASDNVYLRIHSECFTGDVFGSKRCDCGAQLHKSMEIIQQEKGMLIYLRQEGRGIGLISKLKAYNLQDCGMDTAQANTHLGYEVDARTYEDAIAILDEMEIRSISLITNNPLKLKAFEQSDIRVSARVPIVIDADTHNQHYLNTKREKMGHWI